MRWRTLAILVLPFLCNLAGPVRLAVGSGLVAHWKLNESSGTSAADASGSGYTGTVTGTGSWVAGYINNGFSFNGSTKIQAAGLMGNPANVTLAAWVNLTTTDTNGAEVISLGDHAQLRVDAGTNAQFAVYNGSTWTTLNLPSTTLAGTGWHHIAAVFDDTNDIMYIYLDGNPAASQSTSVTISYSGLGANTVIGRHGNGATTYDFTGIIDDARVYNYALSAAEIHDLVGRVAHWKLDEPSGASAADASAYNRVGTVTGTATWSSAVFNNGFTFDGSTKIQASGLLGSPSNITVAGWAKLTSADTSGAEIVSLGDRVYLRLDESGATKASFYNGSSFVTVSVNKTYAGTGWHHFAATFDNPSDSFKLYVDGVQAASTTTTSSISYAGGGANTVIGRNGNSGTSNDLTGMLDDVRVYNYALSASEVAELYGFVGHWKLDQTSGTTATDSSPFAKHGAVAGTANWSTDCGGMGVFDFNGSTNYVSMTNAAQFQPTTALTIAAWVKGDAWGSGGDVDTILRKGDTNPNNFAFHIADGKLELSLDGNNGSGIRGNTVLATGQWYHVAAVWNGSTVRLFVNGVLDNTPPSRSGTIATDTRPLYIGGRTGSTDMFDGMLRGVRFYNRALSDTEIKKLAGLAGYWRFAEGSGTTAADSSGQGFGRDAQRCHLDHQLLR